VILKGDMDRGEDLREVGGISFPGSP
jgi:hypothetical protein